MQIQGRETVVHSIRSYAESTGAAPHYSGCSGHFRVWGQVTENSPTKSCAQWKSIDYSWTFNVSRDVGAGQQCSTFITNTGLTANATCRAIKP